MQAAASHRQLTSFSRTISFWSSFLDRRCRANRLLSHRHVAQHVSALEDTIWLAATKTVRYIMLVLGIAVKWSEVP